MDISPLLLPSFGRRHGRTLRPAQKALFTEVLPRLLITLPEGNLSLQELFLHPDRPLWVEIGFGAGEHLLEQARRNPEVNFIGCEPYINGVATLLAGVKQHNLSNIRILEEDARLLLLKLPDNSIERLFILFPDPWRKNRHHKRRIIAPPSLPIFYAKLKQGGKLRIATDHYDYGVWILENMLLFRQLRWLATRHTDWENPPEGWVPTRYQAKALAQEREPLFLEYIKD